MGGTAVHLLCKMGWFPIHAPFNVLRTLSITFSSGWSGGGGERCGGDADFDLDDLDDLSVLFLIWCAVDGCGPISTVTTLEELAALTMDLVGASDNRDVSMSRDFLDLEFIYQVMLGGWVRYWSSRLAMSVDTEQNTTKKVYVSS